MIDVNSQTWIDVVAYLDTQSVAAMVELQQSGLDYPETEALRARIRAFNDVKNLAETQRQTDIEFVVT